MRGERGEISLAGLLVAMVVFLAVLGATLDLFAGSQTVARDTGVRNEAQDSARSAIDTITRQLRNLASPTIDQPQAIERARARELVFKVVSPSGAPTTANTANIKRVRFCLDDNGTLWKQQQTGDAAVTTSIPGGTNAPDDPTCSQTGWLSNKRALATNLANYANGQARPVFIYNSSTLSAITSVRVDLIVDPDTTRRPDETRLTSGVFLRNQNRAPSASFTITQTTAGLMLNASLSTDPEGDQLTYCWYDTAVSTGTPPPGSPCKAGQYIGQNVTYHYLVANNTNHGIWLEVRDPAGLLGTSSVQSVTKVPPTT